MGSGVLVSSGAPHLLTVPGFILRKKFREGTDKVTFVGCITLFRVIQVIHPGWNLEDLFSSEGPHSFHDPLLNFSFTGISSCKVGWRIRSMFPCHVC